MTYLTIALPEAVRAYVDRQVSSGTYSTADEFFTTLVEREQERQAKQKINDMLRSTLQKDRMIEVTDEWWEQQHKHLTEQLPPQI